MRTRPCQAGVQTNLECCDRPSGNGGRGERWRTRFLAAQQRKTPRLGICAAVAGRRGRRAGGHGAQVCEGQRLLGFRRGLAAHSMAGAASRSEDRGLLREDELCGAVHRERDLSRDEELGGVPLRGILPHGAGGKQMHARGGEQRRAGCKHSWFAREHRYEFHPVQGSLVPAFGCQAGPGYGCAKRKTQSGFGKRRWRGLPIFAASPGAQAETRGCAQTSCRPRRCSMAKRPQARAFVARAHGTARALW